VIFTTGDLRKGKPEFLTEWKARSSRVKLKFSKIIFALMKVPGIFVPFGFPPGIFGYLVLISEIRQLLRPGEGGGPPRKIWWGYAARFPKPSPYL